MEEFDLALILNVYGNEASQADGKRQINEAFNGNPDRLLTALRFAADGERDDASPQVLNPLFGCHVHV